MVAFWPGTITAVAGTPLSVTFTGVATPAANVAFTTFCESTLPAESSSVNAKESLPAGAATLNVQVMFATTTEQPGALAVNPYTVACPLLTATFNCALDGDTHIGRRRLDDVDAPERGTTMERFADATLPFAGATVAAPPGKTELVPCDEHADATTNAAVEMERNILSFMLLHRYRGSRDAYGDAGVSSGIITYRDGTRSRSNRSQRKSCRSRGA